MDAEKNIRRYITKKSWMKAAALVLAAAAVVLAIIGVLDYAGADNTVTAFSSQDSQPGTMARLEVVGISDWLYQSGGSSYYAAQDADGNAYTVCLTGSQFENMAPQALYFIIQGTPPAACELVGYVQSVPEEVRTGLAEVWGITPEEYDSLYGALVLNAATNARREAGMPWFSPAGVCAVLALALYLHISKAERLARKCLARLAALGLTDAAAAQLKDLDSATLLGQDRGLLSQDFLFGRGTGVVLRYQDIDWAYRTERSRFLILPRTVLQVGTRHIGLTAAVDMKSFDRLGVIDDAVDHIQKNSPGAMAGKTKQNAAAFKASLRK